MVNFFLFSLAFDNLLFSFLNQFTVHAIWTTWNNWTQCSQSCGTGNRTRSRICKPPLDGGEPCGGPVPDGYNLIYQENVVEPCVTGVPCPGT